MEEELWMQLSDFPSYDVSNHGRVMHRRRERLMRTSLNNWGHVKISLYDTDEIRRTVFVARLVGECFVEAPDRRSNRIMILNGDLQDVCAWNLAWRPKWFVWKYYRQLRTPIHAYYQNLPVRDMTHAKEYDSIVDAGIAQGLLFDDIWRSTYSGDPIYPWHSVFRVIT